MTHRNAPRARADRNLHRVTWLAAMTIALLMACAESPSGPQGGNVGPEGGRLEFFDGMVVLDVPEGALSDRIAVTVNPAADVPSSPLLVQGAAYEFGPDGTQFATPVTLTIGYGEADPPTGVRGEELRMFTPVGATWQEVLGSAPDPSNRVVRAAITSFSIYGVLGVPVATVVVSPDQSTLTVGSTLQLEAIAHDAAGTALPDRSITWTSDNPEVATVSETGVVTALAEGAVVITAESEGETDSAAITVTSPPVTSVDVTPAVSVVVAGGTVQLTASPRDALGNPLNGREVTWTSNDVAVASVNETGLVTGQATGEAMVIATSEGVGGTAMVTVSVIPVASVQVTPPTVDLLEGESAQLEAVARDAEGNALPNRPIVWTTGDPSVATVDDAGAVTGVAVGETTVTAESEGQTGTAVVTVASAAPTLSTVAEGLDRPVFVTAPTGDMARVFVVEQPGRIRIIENGTLLQTPFLDIQPLVRCCGERGLLSVAFHPRFAENGYFFVHYSDGAGDTRIARYSVTNDPNVADPTSATEILSETQPASNHNGGLLAFGPDGFLYVGLGDGGGAGDPFSNGQDSTTLLGSILRIDVDGTTPYQVPADNPFVGDEAARPEIWAYGLRNPWRFSFDRITGDLYIADVGQNTWEEVDVQPASSGGGENYGWNIMEGAHCFDASTCDQSGLTLPVHEYNHSQGCSITGGYVYRGNTFPGLTGTYFYADLCEGIVRSFRLVGGSATDHRAWTEFGALGQVVSFGEDAGGELYVATLDGRIHQMVPDGG